MKKIPLETQTDKEIAYIRGELLKVGYQATIKQTSTFWKWFSLKYYGMNWAPLWAVKGSGDADLYRDSFQEAVEKYHVK